MSRLQTFVVFLLRIAMGWLFFYAGITKVLDKTWTAGSYIRGAEAFPAFFNWLASAPILPYVDFLNKWGLVLIGSSLIIGLFVRWSASFAVLLMILYYIPVLSFPYVGDHSYIVDEHIIYALILIFLGLVRAGSYWGLDGRFHRHY